MEIPATKSRYSYPASADIEIGGTSEKGEPGAVQRAERSVHTSAYASVIETKVEM